MITGEEGLSGEKLSAFIGDLNALSGKYGKLDRRVDGTLISNDEGYKTVIPGLREHLENRHSGIGVFIGSGGLLSLLPELPVDAALVLDKNPAVLELSDVVAGLVESSATPDEVFRRLNNPDNRARNQILQDLYGMYGDRDLTAGFLKKEAREYGEYHWTDPIRFAQVKQALDLKPVVHVAADITNRDFGLALAGVLQQYGEIIPFANFTNVHTWVRPTTMEFIDDWPIVADAAILYSSHKGALLGDWPKMYLAKGPVEYILQTNADTEQ